VQLLVNHRQELIRSSGIAGLGGPQQFGDTFDRLAGHEPRNPRKKLAPFPWYFRPND
jgi:hypothetical protein